MSHTNLVKKIRCQQNYRSNPLTTQPSTFDHINIKYIWGPHLNHMGTPCKSYGDHTLITHTDLQKVYTLNKYRFPIFIYYKETIKKLATNIN